MFATRTAEIAPPSQRKFSMAVRAFHNGFDLCTPSAVTWPAWRFDSFSCFGWDTNQQSAGADKLKALVEGPFQFYEIGICRGADFRDEANRTWWPPKDPFNVIPGRALIDRRWFALIRAERFVTMGHGCVDSNTSLAKVNCARVVLKQKSRKRSALAALACNRADELLSCCSSKYGFAGCPC